jgi:hypothetical protein
VTKPIRLTGHAHEQCDERGATEPEVISAVRHGVREAAKHDRELCRYNLAFDGLWQGKPYAVKQVAPVIKESDDEIVVITVYVFCF